MQIVNRLRTLRQTYGLPPPLLKEVIRQVYGAMQESPFNKGAGGEADWGFHRQADCSTERTVWSTEQPPGTSCHPPAEGGRGGFHKERNAMKTVTI